MKVSDRDPDWFVQEIISVCIICFHTVNDKFPEPLFRTTERFPKGTQVYRV